MVAAFISVGALLLVMLTGASYSNPVKQVNPASVGSTWEAPSSGGFARAFAAGTPSRAASSPAHPQTVPRRELSHPQPSVHREPPTAAASYGCSSFAAPVALSSRYASGPSAGSTQQSSFQPPSTREIPWAVAPPSPFSGDEPSTRPSALRFASSQPAPSNVSPPGPFPEFQAGELSQYESTLEHGNYESETEEQGLPPHSDLEGFSGQDSTSELQPSGPGRILPPGHRFPYYDYMLLMGLYPPGTITHSSSSFEQGMDHWQDSHYIRDYYPASPSTQQVETLPTDFGAPQIVQQPSQPAKSWQQKLWVGCA